ncbi:hypothetical protein HKK72_29935 [Actinomadura sp. HBU206391]|nr:hypothetical protein [Actinomadura sp. HBU206391]
MTAHGLGPPRGAHALGDPGGVRHERDHRGGGHHSSFVARPSRRFTRLTAKMITNSTQAIAEA